MSKRLLRSIAVYLLVIACIIPSMQLNAEEVSPEVYAQQQAVTTEQPAEATTEATAEQQLTEEELAFQQAVAAVVAEQSTRQIVFIGDSRTVGMKSAVGNDGNIWSAKVGMGYSWMKNTGVPAVESSINANTDVVILMGVNDVRATSYTKKYISYINEKAETWTALGANVYYVSVNPMVFETKSYPGINNTIIEAWNTSMQEGLSEKVTYIDTYTPCLGNLSSRDGIHYNKSSYKLIYSLINQSILLDKLYKEYNITV